MLIERYKRERTVQKRSDVTINRELAFLKNLFTQAITWGKATTNPVKQVRLFQEDNARTRFLTEEEEARLLAHRNPKLKPLVTTALHAGFRKSELLSLRWENIDFLNRLIKVDAAYTKTDPAGEVLLALVRGLGLVVMSASPLAVSQASPEAQRPPALCNGPGRPRGLSHRAPLLARGRCTGAVVHG